MKPAPRGSDLSGEVVCCVKASSDLWRSLLLVCNRLRLLLKENWQPLLVCAQSSQQRYTAFLLLGSFVLEATGNTLVAIVVIIETKNYSTKMSPWYLLVRHWTVVFVLRVLTH